MSYRDREPLPCSSPLWEGLHTRLDALTGAVFDLLDALGDPQDGFFPLSEELSDIAAHLKTANVLRALDMVQARDRDPSVLRSGPGASLERAAKLADDAQLAAHIRESEPTTSTRPKPKSAPKRSNQREEDVEYIRGLVEEFEMTETQSLGVLLDALRRQSEGEKT